MYPGLCHSDVLVERLDRLKLQLRGAQLEPARIASGEAPFGVFEIPGAERLPPFAPALAVDHLAKGEIGEVPDLLVGAAPQSVEKGQAVEGFVRAKTGQLQDARAVALSGYARRSDGEDLVFSILVNGYRGSDEQAMNALDGFLAALVTDPDADPKLAKRP